VNDGETKRDELFVFIGASLASWTVGLARSLRRVAAAAAGVVAGACEGVSRSSLTASSDHQSGLEGVYGPRRAASNDCSTRRQASSAPPGCLTALIHADFDKKFVCGGAHLPPSCCASPQQRSLWTSDDGVYREYRRRRN